MLRTGSVIVLVAAAMTAATAELTADVYATDATLEIQAGEGRVVSISPSLSLGRFTDVEETLAKLSEECCGGGTEGPSVAEVVANLLSERDSQPPTGTIQPTARRHPRTASRLRLPLPMPGCATRRR